MLQAAAPLTHSVSQSVRSRRRRERKSEHRHRHRRCMCASLSPPPPPPPSPPRVSTNGNETLIPLHEALFPAPPAIHCSRPEGDGGRQASRQFLLRASAISGQDASTHFSSLFALCSPSLVPFIPPPPSSLQLLSAICYPLLAPFRININQLDNRLKYEAVKQRFPT